MKIPRKKAILIIVAILAVAAISVTAVVLLKSKDGNQQSSGPIRGEVVGSLERPNDDGYGHKSYAIQTDDGTNYQIDVTGYMFSDLKPEDFGEVCIETPELSRGDKVEFKLPLIEGTEDTYKICYEKDSGEYFLKKL